MKFNKKTPGTKTVNKAGGAAYSLKPEYELVCLALTSFNESKFYESDSEQNERLVSLCEKVDKDFLGKLAVYARKECHMRSVSHVLVSELARLHKGERKYIEATISRVDDMNEIVAYSGNKYGKVLPNSIKKAVRNKLQSFDAYQLAKYKCANKDVKLVDLFNLVHPKPKDEKQAKDWKELINGTLKPADTWEVALSTGKGKEGFEKLIMEGKMGYMALLRNLSNFDKYDISEAARKKVCETIIQPDKVEKSKQLPFRFYSAYKHAPSTEFKDAVSVAMDLAVRNMPTFEGNTAIVLDESGSMEYNDISGRGETTCFDIAKVFTAALFKANPRAKVYAFASHCRELTFSSRTPIIDIVDSMDACGGATNLSSVFKTMNEKFDRIIILSDFQSWVDSMYYASPQKSFDEYSRTVCGGEKSKIYSIDLAGYGTHDFSANNVALISGWSEKIFDLMKFLDKDKDALINTIKNYEIS